MSAMQTSHLAEKGGVLDDASEQVSADCLCWSLFNLVEACLDPLSCSQESAFLSEASEDLSLSPLSLSVRFHLPHTTNAILTCMS